MSAVAARNGKEQAMTDRTLDQMIRAIVQEEITRIDNETLAEATDDRLPHVQLAHDGPAPPLEVSHSDSNPPRLIDRVAKLEQRLNAIERAATARMDRHADRLDALEQAKPIGTSVALPEDFDEAVAKALADGITKPRFGEPIAGRLDALEARLDSHANHLAANANDLDTLEGLLTKLAPRVDGQGTQLAGQGKRLGDLEDRQFATAKRLGELADRVKDVEEITDNPFDGMESRVRVLEANTQETMKRVCTLEQEADATESAVLPLKIRVDVEGPESPPQPSPFFQRKD